MNARLAGRDQANRDPTLTDRQALNRAGRELPFLERHAPFLEIEDRRPIALGTIVVQLDLELAATRCLCEQRRAQSAARRSAAHPNSHAVKARARDLGKALAELRR